MENVKVSQEAKLHCLKSVCDCEVSFKIHLIKLMHTLFPLYSVTFMAVSKATPYQFQLFLGLAYGKQKNKRKIRNTLIFQVVKNGVERTFKEGGNCCFIISITTIKWTPGMAGNRQGRGALCSKVFRMPRICDMTIWLGWVEMDLWSDSVSMCSHKHTPQHTWNFWHHTAQAIATRALPDPQATFSKLLGRSQTVRRM